MSTTRKPRRSKYEPTPEAIEAEYTAYAGTFYNCDGLDAHATGYCGRCGGSGHIHGYEHVEGGVCFGCRGRGKWRLAITNREKCRKNLIREAKARAASERRAAAYLAERREIRAKLRHLPANLRAAFVVLRTVDNGFARSVRAKVIEYGYATEAQHAAIVEAADRVVARNAEVKVAAPEGRVEVRGRVVKAEWREGFSRFSADVLKVLVLVETPAGNYRVWSTAASGLPQNPDTLRGATVEFRATLKRSDRDESFAFASRPTGARWTPAAE